ncbi:MAG: hypothetical protein ACF8NJ_04075 [Phycisphaerales bacterium JB038]
MPVRNADSGEEVGSASIQLNPNEVLRLLCEEIDTFRRRQITTFRQFVIVMGAIVLVASPLDFNAFKAVRIAGGCVCLLTGVLGWLIILSYRSRIHYERIRRQQFLADGAMPSMPFYPVGKRDQVIPGYQGPWVTRALSTPASVLWVSLLKRIRVTCRSALWVLSSRTWRHVTRILLSRDTHSTEAGVESARVTQGP